MLAVPDPHTVLYFQLLLCPPGRGWGLPSVPTPTHASHPSLLSGAGREHPAGRVPSAERWLPLFAGAPAALPACSSSELGPRTRSACIPPCPLQMAPAVPRLASCSRAVSRGPQTLEWEMQPPSGGGRAGDSWEERVGGWQSVPTWASWRTASPVTSKRRAGLWKGGDGRRGGRQVARAL